MLIEFREASDEVVAGRGALECRRNQGGCLYGFEGLEYGEGVGWGIRESGDGSRENSKFACDIEAIEVVCWVWLLRGGQELEVERCRIRTHSVAFFAGHSDNGRKGRSVGIAS